MKLSFKYQFISSFVLMEAIFVLIIVSVNFSFISTQSKFFMDEEIQMSSDLFSELIKRPLMLYDLATIDNEVITFLKIKNVVAVEVFNDKNILISNQNDLSYSFKKIFNENIIKSTLGGGRSYRLYTTDIKDGDTFIGSLKILFENTKHLEIIKNNKNITILLIMLEICLSTILAYIIGLNLTKKIDNLTAVAKNIAEGKNPNIVFNKHDSCEIFSLANSLRIMNKKINKRKQKLEKLSITDPLTKLFNRRYFDEIFDKEVSIARREKKLFCLK